MSEDIEQIRILEKQVYDYFSDAESYKSEISDVFDKIDSAYESLFRQSDEVELRYSYMYFLIRYMMDYSKETILFVEQTIHELWSETITNDDFPIDIMDSVFKANELGYLQDPARFLFSGKRLTENNLNERAISLYSTLEAYISNENDWTNWSICQERMGNFQDCVNIVTKGLEKIPGSMLLHCNLGYFLNKTNKKAAALDKLEQALSIGEKIKYSSYHLYAYAAHLKANIYRELNMPVNAYIEYSRLSAAGDSKPDEVIEAAQEMLSFVERI